ncbi:MAG: hypothetical protein DWQ37_21790 [Planctomycetota bacterium]|nr:MAG: hypothetical protein DWQ37_21790 [Planctomycetota bacterium]
MVDTRQRRRYSLQQMLWGVVLASVGLGLVRALVVDEFGKGVAGLWMIFLAGGLFGGAVSLLFNIRFANDLTVPFCLFALAGALLLPAAMIFHAFSQID